MCHKMLGFTFFYLSTHPYIHAHARAQTYTSVLSSLSLDTINVINIYKADTTGHQPTQQISNPFIEEIQIAFEPTISLHLGKC